VVATADVGRVTLSWNASTEPDLADYEVARRADDGSWTLQARTTATSLVIDGLQPGVQASFRVTALNAAGATSTPSAVASATPLAPVTTSSLSSTLPAGDVGTTITTPVAPPVSPTPPPPSTAVGDGPARVRTVRVIKQADGVRALRFEATAAMTITLRVTRTVSGTRRTTTRRVKVGKGVHTLRLTSALLGSAKRRGTATVRLVAPGNQRSLRVKLR
jgi:hypothetical protein